MKFEWVINFGNLLQLVVLILVIKITFWHAMRIVNTRFTRLEKVIREAVQELAASENDPGNRH